MALNNSSETSSCSDAGVYKAPWFKGAERWLEPGLKDQAEHGKV